MTDKKQLRKELITKRKKMTDEEFSNKSLSICNRLLNNSQYLKSKVIYCYYSVNKEVDLLPFKVREGNVLLKKSDGTFTLSNDEEKKRKAQAYSLQEKIFGNR